MTGRESLFEIITALPQAETVSRHVLKRGDILLEKGSASEEMFFVLAGRFVARIGDSVVGYIEAGSVVGELNFFTGQPRSATVEAVRDSVVLCVGREEYEAMTRAAPELKDAVAAELAARVAGLNMALVRAAAQKPLPRAMAIVPAGNGPDVREVAHRLARCLDRMEPSNIVTRADAPPGLAAGGFDSAEAIGWFSDRGIEKNLVVYAADPEDAGWNAAILRQADHVLVLGRAGPVPSVSAVERAAFEMIDPDDRTLLLLHETRANRVSGTPPWRDSREVGRHHHVCLADDGDLDRVARFLTGRAVGLVCSGGGALGPAQVGIWSAFREAGVLFDIFVGTSVGSAVAAALSLGLDQDEFARRTEEIFVRNRALRRPTLPRYSLLDHTAFDRELHAHFGETDVRDLWLPFHSVASNLSRRSVEVIGTGKLWEAVRASASIPGMLPPFIAANGDVLADGGATANVPIEPMRALKRGPNLILSVERERIPPFETPQRFPGRGELLYGLVNPRHAERFPKGVGLTTTLVQAMIIGQASRRLDILPNEILIEPPLPPEFTFMSWSKHRELLAFAERYGRDWLRAHPEAPDILMSRAR